MKVTTTMYISLNPGHAVWRMFESSRGIYKWQVLFFFAFFSMIPLVLRNKPSHYIFAVKLTVNCSRPLDVLRLENTLKWVRQQELWCEYLKVSSSVQSLIEPECYHLQLICIEGGGVMIGVGDTRPPSVWEGRNFFFSVFFFLSTLTADAIFSALPQNKIN